MTTASKLANKGTPTIFSRVFLAAEAAVTALRDPARHDMVAALGETTGLGAAERLRDLMLLDATGRRILRERPIISPQTIDLDKLAQLPRDTFGYQYAHFLEKFNVSPTTRMPVRYIGDEELAYVMLRYRQVHDFWHVLTGIPVSVQAEIALKWFEYAQTGLPSTLLSSVFGPLRLNAEERDELFEVHVPWALQTGSQAPSLMNVMYEDLLEEKISDVRDRLKVNPLQLQPRAK